ncbi:glutamate racemase [Lyngbya confervoides]|uniref:Glutamate racemase n=1 Tax=Lyngbya confervoides BDU141951 TaxID=1574623 RepID=A0ABD4T2F4_9CYAN|nr:glutamate racemase [Lyngbya confervoides]MCM1982699.1 glutamate racemase [Lyngbya confervoides BDU141951]
MNHRKAVSFSGLTLALGAASQTEARGNALPIGVFDSGVGGLTVLKQLQRQLPQESFVYFGDTANVPYGGRSGAELLGFTQRILDWMQALPVKMAVMACNTSSAVTLEQVRHAYSFPILGLILPAAKAAARQGTRIGLIATQATVDSQCYLRALQEIKGDLAVFQVACPEFVPLIEQGKLECQETREIVQARLQPLIEARIDTLIYGCTHYPHLSRVIQAALPEGVSLIDPALHIAQAAAQELHLLRLQTSATERKKKSKVAYFVSGCPERFADQTFQLTGQRPSVVQVPAPQPQASKDVIVH